MRALCVVSAALLLASCSGWFGGSEEPPLPGERIDLLATIGATEADEAVAGQEIRLPEPIENPEWPQDGGVPEHAMPHLAIGESPTIAWRADAGRGTGGDAWLLAQPVIAGGRVFTMDSGAEVRALDADTGDLAWSRELSSDDDGILGGGLGVADGRLYATTGSGQVVALDAGSGEEIWRKSLNGPIRAAPTIRDGRVFVVTIANELFALSAADGRLLWNHAGIAEVAGLVGGAAPAVDQGVVVAPFTSGEAVALRAENGRVVWTESLTSLRRSDAVTSLAHIRGRPVIDGGLVYVVGHSRRTVAIDFRTGNRLWEASVGGLHGPWAAGDFVFVMTRDAELVCLTRDGGLVRWVTKLPRYEDEEDREEPIFWAGPVLAGNHLFVAGSTGELLSISPASGEVADRTRLPGPVLIPPSVARKTLYLLTEDAELVALR